MAVIGWPPTWEVVISFLRSFFTASRSRLEKAFGIVEIRTVRIGCGVGRRGLQVDWSDPPELVGPRLAGRHGRALLPGAASMVVKMAAGIAFMRMDTISLLWWVSTVGRKNARCSSGLAFPKRLETPT